MDRNVNENPPLNDCPTSKDKKHHFEYLNTYPSHTTTGTKKKKNLRHLTWWSSDYECKICGETVSVRASDDF